MSIGHGVFNAIIQLGCWCSRTPVRYVKRAKQNKHSDPTLTPPPHSFSTPNKSGKLFNFIIFRLESYTCQNRTCDMMSHFKRSLGTFNILMLKICYYCNPYFTGWPRSVNSFGCYRLFYCIFSVDRRKAKYWSKATNRIARSSSMLGSLQ